MCMNIITFFCSVSVNTLLTHGFCTPYLCHKIPPKFRTVAMFVVGDLQTIFHVQYVVMYMLYVLATYHP